MLSVKTTLYKLSCKYLYYQAVYDIIMHAEDSLAKRSLFYSCNINWKFAIINSSITALIDKNKRKITGALITSKTVQNRVNMC